MLRVALALMAILVSVTLLFPTIVSVGDAVEDLELRREMPWKIWKRDTEVFPTPSTCDVKDVPTESEVTEWPARIRKDEPFQLGGHVISPTEGGRGIPGVLVELWLNETKEEPGVYLGATATDAKGRFVLNATVPFELQASRYHLLAHSFERKDICKTYLEHWSDPEMDVHSDTTLTLDAPERVVAGRPVTITGTLLDMVGAPVIDKRVVLRIGDERHELVTDDAGRFTWTGTPRNVGELPILATFEGNDHYEGSEARSKMLVVGEDVRIPASESPEGIEVDRGHSARLEGTLIVPPERASDDPATLRFDGLQVVGCAGCAPSDRVTFQPDEEGRFVVEFLVPSTQEPGRYNFVIEGAGLREPANFNLTVFVPTTIELSLASGGWFEERYTGEARLLDDRGQPLEERLVLVTPTGLVPLAPGDGVSSFSAQAPCGRQDARVAFEGTGELRPASATDSVIVCPLGMLLAPFGMPWWVWLLALAAIGGALYAARSWRAERAPVIRAGPPLALSFVADDLAPGVAGLHESVVALVKLESPLPAGHTLRVGRQGAMKAVEPSDALEARHTLVPERLGKLAVRAEIVDARGRVVTRRTEFLRVVRYAEEIESRYRALKQAGLGEVADRVSPREFEAWLREHAADLEPEISRRLVAIFEEADYGPRDVGRRELLGYLNAERRLQGVGRPVR